MKLLRLLQSTLFAWAALAAAGNVGGLFAQDLAGTESASQQANSMLEADRDAFTPATTTVGKDIRLLESSYAYIDNRHDADINSVPETLFRYGLTDRVELRVGWNYEGGGSGNVVTANESSEGLFGRGVEYESYALYGVKVAVTKQQGWIPESCAIVEGFTPTAGHGTATKPVVTYSGGWKYSGGWELDSAIRYGMGNEEDHDDPLPEN
jgi:hypothetical protein